MAKTIIEKEIERRESLIVEKSEKEAIILEMRAEIEKTEAEIAGIDEVTLEAEIEELKSYLPKPESEVDETVVEAQPTEFASPYYVG